MSEVISCGKMGVRVKLDRTWIQISRTELKQEGIFPTADPVPRVIAEEQKKRIMEYALAKYGP